MSTDKLYLALGVLMSATSFGSKKSRDAHSRAGQGLREVIASHLAAQA
jgi:hypothetical protein